MRPWYARVLPAETHYCRSCWRNETHRPLLANALATSLAIAGSCGLVLLLWPYQCVTCGRLRARLHWRGQSSGPA